MDFSAIEKKWQTKWNADKTFNFDNKNLKNKEYILEMFSYPSGSRLHIGHLFNFTIPDSFAKYEIMKGKNVFHPMGFDAFGLPAENYALKTGIHPRESTNANMEYMEKQLNSAGLNYDWDCTLRTCEPTYYKWTQWLFLQLFKKGLAYQKFAPVNWCSSCNTVLANEQVVDGVCERCGTKIIKKNLTQWFFKITDYAEDLLAGLDKIDWPEKTKISQKNWIGKSVGSEVDFDLENGKKITVFTTRVDTIYGITYLVLAPEHPLVLEITTPENMEQVKKYIAETAKKDDITRQSTTLEKTGVFTGAYVIHPLTNKKVPVYIADYALATYATGAVMAVPAHDERDFAFAKKYGLDIITVIENSFGETVLPYTANGKLVNSDIFNGMASRSVKDKIIAHLEKLGKGNKKINYKLRDWSVSRQRYWGCPIPIIHCEHCGAVPVPEQDLPVILPETMEYKPDGRSPLAKNEKYINTFCPVCGRPAKRDPDTLDTFVCSSFYMLRYPCANNTKKIFDTDFVNQICPVDYYIGGMEHANGHLLYSRFITKVLHDLKYLNFDEPFKKLVHQGMILGPDGQKMSKSKGNVINPDDIIALYGADAVRLYLMFGFNYVDGGPWNDDGIKNCLKFLERVERIVETAFGYNKNLNPSKYDQAEKELDFASNFAIKEFEKNMQDFTFNSAVARIMEFVNSIYKYNLEAKINAKFMQEKIKDLLKILAPCAPHFAEELWQKIGNSTSIFASGFPKFEESKLIKEEIEIAIQINSKIVARQVVKANATNKEIEELAKTLVKDKLENKTIIKSIIIPSRLINFIVK
ncbi:MAG: leucine--tRNA ligase [Clostridia bacterium]|nr:leucine--tRNA ligase [Clostridia bacterium]